MTRGYTSHHAESGISSKLPSIATWKNQYDRSYEIIIKIPEFTSICPKTKLPDFGFITLTYIPDKLCVELKSLKYYITAYRPLGIFYENAINKILDDFVRYVKPKQLEIKGEFTSRGGISSTVIARYHN